MKTIPVAILTLALALGTAVAQVQSPIAKVSALASGQLLLNGRPSDITAIEAEFKTIKEKKGSVWYYRENGKSEPPPSAMAVIQLVVKYGLPISMSSKPDFSDYIDGNGSSKPRKP
jgi:hypothetical protein